MMRGNHVKEQLFKINRIYRKILTINDTPENKWRPPKVEQAKAIYPEIAIAQASITVACLGRDSKVGRGMLKALQWKKCRGSGRPSLEAVGMRKLEAAD